MAQELFNQTEINLLFDDLSSKGWATSKNLFSKEFCLELAQECQSHYQNGHFQKASIGIGDSKHIENEIRGDFTLWLDHYSLGQSSSAFLSAIEFLQTKLNAAFFLGLKRFESHFAYYPPGAGYDKHWDNHNGLSNRRVTFILYLNENWVAGDGGELKVFSEYDENNLIATIEPHLGMFMIFRSELFPHQVEKSIRNRKSLTGWFRNDIL